MKNLAKNAKGATLAVTLIILLLLTLIGITALRVSTQEERMAANLQDQGFAFQAAESALQEAENWLLSVASEPLTETSCTVQPCVLTFNETVNPAEQTATWWTNNGATFNTGILTEIDTAPRYVIEFLRFVRDDDTVGLGYIEPGTYFYRVTARATGMTDNSTATVQSTVGRRF